MAKRKAWSELSPAYRSRLERQGITRETHAQGADIAKARGKRSRAAENESRRKQRRIDSWIRRYADHYYADEDELREQLEGYDQEAIYRAIDTQERIEEMWNEGDWDEAHDLWEEMRESQDVPEWMLFYHGVFSI